MQNRPIFIPGQKKQYTKLAEKLVSNLSIDECAALSVLPLVPLSPSASPYYKSVYRILAAGYTGNESATEQDQINAGNLHSALQRRIPLPALPLPELVDDVLSTIGIFQILKHWKISQNAIVA